MNKGALEDKLSGPAVGAANGLTGPAAFDLIKQRASLEGDQPVLERSLLLGARSQD
jgi:hypothetical protein